MLPLALYTVYVSYDAEKEGVEPRRPVWVFAAEYQGACARGAALLGISMDDAVAAKQSESSVLRAAEQLGLQELAQLIRAKRDAKPTNIQRILEILNAVHLAEKRS